MSVKTKKGSFTCQCDPGYIRAENGIDCIDDDECVSGNQCSDNAQCTNTIGSYDCDCFAGYEGSGRYCTDINECSDRFRDSLTNCPAHAKCKNTPGSYECSCRKGFDGEDCEDIDECADGTKCSGENEICQNTEGSYRCLCDEGFSKDARGVCTDIDECDYGIDDCHIYAQCTNKPGSYLCECIEGFEGDGIDCHDESKFYE